MFVNFLKITLRNLLKNKTQSFILIGGLTIGMATCILLLQYVSYELSFDRFHKNQDNIYRVLNQRFQNGQSVQKGTITYPTIGPTMKMEYPEIKNMTRLAFSTDVMISQGDRVEPVEPGLWVDEHFFEIFDFEMLAGERIDLMSQPNEMILTRQLADKYFPAAKGNYEMVIGEELAVDRYEDNFKIVAVCEDVPANSHLDFDLLLSYASCIRYWGAGADESWTWSDFYHYVQLAPGTDVAKLEAKFADFSERHFRGAEVSGSEEVFTLQALSDAHLYSSDLEYEIGQTANGRAVWSLLIIAFFILFLAWINYVNLSSVRAIERAKEVGVRKVVGATRKQLIGQFLTEAILVNLLSLFIAFLMVELLSPWFAANFGIKVAALSLFSGLHFNTYLFAGLVGFIALGILISGAYPAWLLSSTEMVSVLKGFFSRNSNGAWLRKCLVVFQFTMSVALITGAYLVAQQIDFMTKQDLGINIDEVMIINSPEMTVADSTFIEKMNTFKSALVAIPGIESATTSNRSPGERMGRAFNIRRKGAGPEGQTFTSNLVATDYTYGETYDIETLAGRYFRLEDHNINGSEVDKIILNEAARKMLGFADAEKAVGASVNIYERDWQIVGVIPDFHQRSLHHAIEPIMFMPFYGTNNQLSVKVSGDNVEQIISQLKTTYATFFPGNTFQYSFLDERFQQLYEADIRFGNILSFFTLLTILIACLGLFGLASYTTFLRTKEIGIRKVLGASVSGIIALLAKDFLKLVLLSVLIAAPLAYFFLEKWLADFAYKIEMPWWVFAMAGGLALGLAFLTVGAQSLKAALHNPLESLRNE